MRITASHSLESLFRFVIFLLVFVYGAGDERHVVLFLWFAGKPFGLGDVFFGLFKLTQPGLHLRKSKVDLPVFGSILEQRFDLGNTLICLTVVGQLLGEKQFKRAAVGIFLGRFLRRAEGLRPLLVGTVDVYKLLVGALGAIASKLQHLAKRVLGQGVLLLLAVNFSQPFQEYRAVVAFPGGVVIVGPDGLL